MWATDFFRLNSHFQSYADILVFCYHVITTKTYDYSLITNNRKTFTAQ